MAQDAQDVHMAEESTYQEPENPNLERVRLKLDAFGKDLEKCREQLKVILTSIEEARLRWKRIF